MTGLWSIATMVSRAGGRKPAACVRSCGVIVFPPLFDQDLLLCDAGEDFAVEEFVTEASGLIVFLQLLALDNEFDEVCFSGCILATPSISQAINEALLEFGVLLSEILVSAQGVTECDLIKAIYIVWRIQM